MATLQEQILARLKLALVAVPDVVTVERSRKTAFEREETPAIVIRPDAEQDERMSQTTDHHTFTALVIVHTRGDPWDAVADPLVEAAHRIVMKDPVIQTMALDVRRVAREPEDQEADATAGAYTLHYRFIYLSRADDLSAQP